LGVAHLQRPRRPLSTRLPGAVKFLLVAVALVIALAPMLYVVSASLRPGRTLIEYPPQWLPDSLYLRNFTHLFGDTAFLRWVANTMLVATTVTVVKLLIDSMAAYALAKMHFFGERVLYGVMLCTIMIPPSLLLIPLYFVMRDIGLLDTYWALILPALANPFGIVVLRAFIRNLPEELEQAARVDGASPWRVYWHVILPSIRPALVVVGGYIFLLQYVDFVWPLVATQSDDLRLVTTGLARLSPKSNTDPDYGLISAGAICSLIPVALAVLFLQRRLRDTDLSGGLKG
jgi:ABC-type glycerol-3-phosphate transport system permease component